MKGLWKINWLREHWKTICSQKYSCTCYNVLSGPHVQISLTMQLHALGGEGVFMCDGWSTGSRREAGRIIQSINCLNRSLGSTSNSFFVFRQCGKNWTVLLAKMQGKSLNCLGSVNRTLDRVVCHPAALGWHRRATDDTLQRTKVCFDQLSGGRACRPIVLVISWGEGYWLLLLETGTFMRREWGRPDVWTLAHVYSGTVLLRQ